MRFQSPEEHDYRNVIVPIFRKSVNSAIERAQERTNIANRLHIAEQQQEADKIIDWLSPPDVSKEHILADEQHQEGTGQWLLQSHEFQKWFALGGGNHLWLYGKSGYGKTVLFYSLVEYLKRQCKSTKFGIAKFYFTFRDAEKQTYSGLILSLLAQLSSTKSGLVLLQKVYENRHKERPGPKELERIFVYSLADYDQVVVCLDAIDECSKAARRDLLGRIKQLAQDIPKLKLLLTTQFLDDIEKVLVEDLRSETIDLNSKTGNTDIQSFLNTELKFENDERKTMITRHLTNMAEGS